MRDPYEQKAYVNPQVPWAPQSAQHYPPVNEGNLEKTTGNPYRQPGELLGVGLDLEAETALSRGLDGDAIDSLLKTRMVEGMRIGHDRGEAAAKREFEQIWDRGFERGLEQGHGLSAEALRLQKRAFVMGMYGPLRMARDQLLLLASRAKPGGAQQQGLDEVTEILVALLAVVQQNADQAGMGDSPEPSDAR